MTKLKVGSADEIECCDTVLSPHAVKEIERNPLRVVTRARLVRALRTMAMIVSAPGGEVYSPIFERLEQELADVDRRQSVVARAKALAQEELSPRRGRAIRHDVEALDLSRN